MSNIKIFSKLLGNIDNFKKYILDSIAKSINTNLFTKLNVAETEIRNIVIRNIRSQPEYISLKSGSLRNQFGLANTSVVDAILSELDDIQIKISKAKTKGSSIEATFIVNMIKEDFSEIVSSNAGVYTTENGSKIDWLRWLLLEGQNSVIIGYRYLPKLDPRSRTGRGIMVGGESAVYRVPPEFAGTQSDNWITRGVDSALPEIESYMNKIVKQTL